MIHVQERPVPLYTKTGDAGETGLFDGTRVLKSDARVDAYGEVDETSAAIGLARAHGVDSDLDAMLAEIQRDLFALGAMLADPRHRIASRVTKAAITDDHIARLEGWIDQMQAQTPPLRKFVLAGGAVSAAQLHLARAISRRAERRIVGLGHDAADPAVIIYINRLSDLLFAMARVANVRAGVPEVEW